MYFQSLLPGVFQTASNFPCINCIPLILISLALNVFLTDKLTHFLESQTSEEAFIMDRHSTQKFPIKRTTWHRSADSPINYQQLSAQFRLMAPGIKSRERERETQWESILPFQRIKINGGKLKFKRIVSNRIICEQVSFRGTIKKAGGRRGAGKRCVGPKGPSH